MDESDLLRAAEGLTPIPWHRAVIGMFLILGVTFVLAFWGAFFA